jgi:prepilin-type N-terminal cleavage/methylation domain-containing protein
MIDRRASSWGFTLIEMVVVLALFGVLAALVIPSVGRQLDARSKQLQLDAIIADIKALPVSTLLSGKSLSTGILLNGPILAPIQLPAEWQVSFEPPLNISHVPACTASKITITSSGSSQPQAVLFMQAGICKLEAYRAELASQ